MCSEPGGERAQYFDVENTGNGVKRAVSRRVLRFCRFSMYSTDLGKRPKAEGLRTRAQYLESRNGDDDNKQSRFDAESLRFPVPVQRVYLQ